MRNATLIFALLCGLALPAVGQSAPNQTSAPPQTANIDGIAVRIGDDVVTESEVRQLEDYQQLVDGRSQSRTEVLQELVDQWIVRTEAAAAKYPRPTANEVSQEFQALAKQFKSPQEFQRRLAQAGLAQDDVRQVIERQLYYVRFLDYKFHAASQVTSAEIESYYQKQLAPQLEKKGMSLPPLNQVEAQIRQLLTQEEINKKAAQWLEEAKARLRIVIQPAGGGG
ncbi:MAG TPA: hypothetical protein VGU63_12330 [Candidatus Acidoferrales bacterium]|nr:hypothetical protein [Candidatus Acidoferrales bacterium]